MSRAALESTRTQWRSRETGERLIAVALKEDDGICMVLPIRHGGVHPLDWVSESAFLAEFEVAA